MNSLHQRCAAKVSSEEEREGAEGGTSSSQLSSHCSGLKAVLEPQQQGRGRWPLFGLGKVAERERERSRGFRDNSVFSRLVRRTQVGVPIPHCPIPGLRARCASSDRQAAPYPLEGVPATLGIYQLRARFIRAGCGVRSRLFVLKCFVPKSLSLICV